MRADLQKLALLCLVMPMLALPSLSHARSDGAGPGHGANPVSPAPNHPHRPATPDGFWMIQRKDAVIQIASCGNGLCGDIAGMFLGPNDPAPRDWAGTSQCRLIIIRAAPRIGGNSRPIWTGRIIDPRNGNAYHAIIRLDAQNNLLLRGYIGLPIFGETQTWTPYNGTVAQDCRLPPPLG